MFRTARRPAGTVQYLWRTQSLASVWPADPAEWHTPAVDAVCDAFLFGTACLEQSCRLLGEHAPLCRSMMLAPTSPSVP
jgi:hypothetical protein